MRTARSFAPVSESDSQRAWTRTTRVGRNRSIRRCQAIEAETGNTSRMTPVCVPAIQKCNRKRVPHGDMSRCYRRRSTDAADRFLVSQIRMRGGLLPPSTRHGTLKAHAEIEFFRRHRAARMPGSRGLPRQQGARAHSSRGRQTAAGSSAFAGVCACSRSPRSCGHNADSPARPGVQNACTKGRKSMSQILPFQSQISQLAVGRCSRFTPVG